MSVFAVDRRVFDHPMFAPEPYTEREAWLWLVGAAAWKPTKVRVGRSVFELERGQLAFSERFLAAKWKWSRSRVTRFLIRLKNETMVRPLANHEATQLTICNYDKYAFGRTTREPLTEPLTEPLANHCRTKEEEVEELKKKDLVHLKANGRVSYEGFQEFYTAYPKHQSKQDAVRAYSQVRKKGISHEAIMAGLQRAKRSDSRFREMRFTPLPASWLRAGGFEDETTEPSVERMLLA